MKQTTTWIAFWLSFVVGGAGAQADERNPNRLNVLFIAVDDLRTELGCYGPKKYWDLYNREDIPMAANPLPPKDAPKQAPANWAELRAYEDIPASGPVTDEQARLLKHGYYACVSYTDAQIGRVLQPCELYDHENDPLENVNVAGSPENGALVRQLTEQMRAGWKAARDPAVAK